MESIKNRLTSSSAAGDLSIVVPVALTILRTIKVVMGFAATSRGRLGYAVGATAVAPILICTSVKNSSLLDPAARRAAADKLKELYATAQLEEKQNNMDASSKGEALVRSNSFQTGPIARPEILNRILLSPRLNAQGSSDPIAARKHCGA